MLLHLPCHATVGPIFYMRYSENSPSVLFCSLFPAQPPQHFVYLKDIPLTSDPGSVVMFTYFRYSYSYSFRYASDGLSPTKTFVALSIEYASPN